MKENIFSWRFMGRFLYIDAVMYVVADILFYDTLSHSSRNYIAGALAILLAYNYTIEKKIIHSIIVGGAAIYAFFTVPVELFLFALLLFVISILNIVIPRKLEKKKTQPVAEPVKAEVKQADQSEDLTKYESPDDYYFDDDDYVDPVPQPKVSNKKHRAHTVRTGERPPIARFAFSLGLLIVQLAVPVILVVFCITWIVDKFQDRQYKNIKEDYAAIEAKYNEAQAQLDEANKRITELSGIEKQNALLQKQLDAIHGSQYKPYIDYQIGHAADTFLVDSTLYVFENSTQQCSDETFYDEFEDLMTDAMYYPDYKKSTQIDMPYLSRIVVCRYDRRNILTGIISYNVVTNQIESMGTEWTLADQRNDIMLNTILNK